MVNEGYQRDDAAILDYGLWSPPNVDERLSLRGPAIDLVSGQYAVVLGAAQTFGRFVERPYPALLAELLGIPVLNLGFSGAGPTFFLDRPQVIGLINRARFAIVQMTSGRSVSNSRFEVQGNQGQVVDRRAAEPATKRFAEDAYADLIRSEPIDELVRLRAETRWRYVEASIQLLSAIRVPKILFYFSTRSPRYPEGTRDVHGYWGGFPHFVNEAVVEQIRPYSDAYVECISADGLPQSLFDRTTGEPVLMWPEAQFPKVKLRHHNHYYPSPQMHVAAASTLEQEAARFADGRLVTNSPAACRSARRQVLVHMHIFKNAGTSVDHLLQHSFGNRFVMTDPPTSSAVLSERELCEFLVEHPEVRAVAAHQLRQPTVGNLDIQLVPYVMLRHPIDRLHSGYVFERTPDRRLASSDMVTRWANELDFKGYLERLLEAEETRALLFNFQTRACCRFRPWSVAMNDADLTEALSFIGSLPAVGVVEEFERSIARLRSSLHHTFPELRGGEVRVNVTREFMPLERRLEQIRSEIGDVLYSTLVDGNALDLELRSQALLRLG